MNLQNNLYSKIIISNDFEGIKNKILTQNDPNFVRIFEYENLLVENAKDIINEAYISEAKQKIILILSKKFGIESQNSLLKILEEPPRNIVFIIVSPSKNLLLPTIRSRLIIESKNEKQNLAECKINLKKLELKEIYDFIDEQLALEKLDKLSKIDLINLVKSLVIRSIELGVKFKEEDYEYFLKVYRLIDLNAKVAGILTPVLLLIMQRQQ